MAGIATLVLGGFGLFNYIRNNGRELNLSSVVISANPPADISPALIGKLTGQQHNFMGTVLISQRDILEVREEKGFLGMKKITYWRARKARVF